MNELELNTESRISDPEDRAFLEESTGLLDRRGLIRYINHLTGNKLPVRQEFALAVLNVKRYRMLRQSLNHRLSVALLRAISLRLVELTDGLQVCASIGLASFALVYEHRLSEIETRMQVQRLMTRLVEPFEVEGREFSLDFALGVVMQPLAGETSQELLNRAEITCEQAAEGGRMRVRYYSQGMALAIAGQVALEQALSTAIKHNELSLVFQPKVCSEAKLVGAEALLRWTHPRFGVVPPDRFIPIAEASGLIIDIGNWVLQQVCALMADWREQGLTVPLISINISTQQLSDPDFRPHLEHSLALYDIPACKLELEITEQVCLTDIDWAIHTLNAFRKMGIHIALDDFGKGYSSLNYLRSLPVDAIKIDRLFVSECDNDAVTAGMLRAILDLATVFGLTTVAEGVERQQQVDVLEAHGCSCFQGFLFSRPVPENRFQKVLRNPILPSCQT